MNISCQFIEDQTHVQKCVKHFFAKMSLALNEPKYSNSNTDFLSILYAKQPMQIHRVPTSNEKEH